MDCPCRDLAYSDYATWRNGYATWRNEITLLGVMITLLGVPVKWQLPRIHRHADDGIYLVRVKAVDLVPRRDAAGRRHTARRHAAHGQDGVDVGSLHQA